MDSQQQVFSQGISQVASLMCLAARTAPKAKGKDRLIIRVLEGKDKDALAQTMEEIAASGYVASAFSRDAKNLNRASAVVLIGTKLTYMGLNCNFCGFGTCAECKNKGGHCAFDAMDLGVAIGSAASVAANMHVDNRLMYTIGYAATKNKLLGEEAAFAIGIPLSATGKNIFFDRETP